MSGPQRIFTASPAVREQVPLLIGIVSPSGGGKTYSALRLATGIQRVLGVTKPIVVIDTENRRALHYADQFKFLHVPFPPPFGAEDYKQAIRYAAAQKPSCIIIDSMTHEHAGEGGLLDSHDKILDRMAGDDWNKREKSSMAAWARVKPLRTQLIEDIKQISGAMIMCWRGQEKMKPMRTAAGKTEIVPQGLCAIGGKEWIFEMTVSCLLPPRSDGVPDWSGQDVGERLEMKLPIQFRNLLRPGTVLNEEVGQAMAEWAVGGVPHPRDAANRTAPAAPTVPPSPQPDAAGVTPPPEHGEDVAKPSRDSFEFLKEVEVAKQLEADLMLAVAEGENAYRKAWTAAMRTDAFKRDRAYFIERRDPWLAMAREVDQRQLAELGIGEEPAGDAQTDLR